MANLPKVDEGDQFCPRVHPWNKIETKNGRYTGLGWSAVRVMGSCCQVRRNGRRVQSEGWLRAPQLGWTKLMVCRKGRGRWRVRLDFIFLESLLHPALSPKSMTKTPWSFITRMLSGFWSVLLMKEEGCVSELQIEHHVDHAPGPSTIAFLISINPSCAVNGHGHSCEDLHILIYPRITSRTWRSQVPTLDPNEWNQPIEAERWLSPSPLSFHFFYCKK